MTLGTEKIGTEKLNAIILGSTGLVGGKCLDQLLNTPQYSNVVALTRRPLEGDSRRGGNATLLESIIHYDELATYTPEVAIDHVFCAFGTTLSRAGSQEAMQRVDVDIPLAFFRRMKKLGAKHASLVSSIGANPSSRSFYPRIKGELEVELLRLGFESVDIFRPSVIGGSRKDDARPAERIMQFVLRFAPKSLRTIPAATIARAMVSGAIAAKPGHRTVLSQHMW
ncbi:hypothetical protein HQ496_01955 [bacterium]|nr:hypothetical protein [bacterium]